VPASEAEPFQAEPFQITVDAAVIDDLRGRIRNARLPEASPGRPWGQGTDRDWLAGLLGYWAGGFDWRAAERALNGFAHYRARVGGAEIHFVHERARRGTGIPLILGHGWSRCSPTRPRTGSAAPPSTWSSRPFPATASRHGPPRAG